MGIDFNKKLKNFNINKDEIDVKTNIKLIVHCNNLLIISIQLIIINLLWSADNSSFCT